MDLIKRLKKKLTMKENVGRHTHLFQAVDFKSHSGLDLNWKGEIFD